jgi:hypothetical protein
MNSAIVGTRVVCCALSTINVTSPTSDISDNEFPQRDSKQQRHEARARYQ